MDATAGSPGPWPLSMHSSKLHHLAPQMATYPLAARTQVRKTMDASSHPALLLVDGVSSIAALDFQVGDGQRRQLLLPRVAASGATLCGQSCCWIARARPPLL